MRTNRVLLTAAAVMAVALAGCGSGGGAKVPTAGGGGRSTSAARAGGRSSGNDTAAYVDSQRKWVACMRKNGVDLPDPDTKGQVDLTGQGSALKKNPTFLGASQKCADLRATVPKDLEADRLKLTPAQIEAQRDYAACMQKNGALDFPDPGPDGYSGDDNSGAPVWDQSSAGARRAARVCAPIIGGPTDAPAARG